MVLWVLNIFNFYKKNIYLYYSIINMSDNSFAGINFNDPETMQIFATHEKMMCPQYKENDESMFSFDIKTDTKNNKNIFTFTQMLSLDIFFLNKSKFSSAMSSPFNMK